MAFQDASGQWYDDNYNPIADPSGGQSAPAGNTIAPNQITAANGTPWTQNGTPVTAVTNGATNFGGRYDAAGNLIPAPQTPSPAGGDGADTGSGGPANNAGFQWPGYQLPTPYQFTPFSYDSYTPLTADAASQEPGYAFARDQGRNAIETSAAARGNVLSGANLKDLFSWGDQFAGQNYQNAETRNENIYNMNRGNAFNNWAGNQAGGLATWQANNQPGQFQAGSITQPQAALTFADLFNRFKTGVDANTSIATAGAV